MRVHSDIIKFQGSHYDFGYMQGERLLDSHILPNRKKQWFSKKNYHFLIDEQELHAIMHVFAPHIWDELRGLAGALRMSMEDAIRYFGGFYLEYIVSGCSMYASPQYMIRNYDNAPLSYEGRYVLYQPTDGGYATIGPSMQITGRTDGMNEKGLAMGYNFINRKQSRDGFVCNMIGRIVLEMCANVDEAISLLKEIPHRHSFSYLLIDPSGKTSIVEASPRSVTVRDGNVCTNHFTSLTEENRYQMDDSLRRYEAMTKQQHSLTNSFNAFQMMNDPTNDVFSNNYGAWSGTIHTAFYHPKQLQAGISIGANRLPLAIDFKSWLAGTPLNAVRINGELDTTTPFVNMIEL